ncbi:hypothetical protein Ciccas_001212 [Cichlidogyrus casuarinus]|uniref:Acetyl-CoA carboxylase n=1 Tax=Cichlidogyrus casuarinus TaxID=1844966 RepID=A0ABD2QKM9_9PLAT
MPNSKKKSTKKATSPVEPVMATMGSPDPKMDSKLTQLPQNSQISVHSFASYVELHNPTRIIKKVLIANNGIAALKFIRSIRKWSYATFKNVNEIKFFCLATPEDIHANAEYIKIADKIITVPGGSNVNNYANVELIIQKAVENQVDAVWAGWGHASENPQLPGSLAKKNIIFLGPSQHAMWSLGDKIAATILAQSVNVPTVPWSGSHLRLDLDHEDQQDEHRENFIAREMFNSACITNAKECAEKCQEIGFPVMIKASEGGGGKGIRKAQNADQAMSLFNQVVNEVPGSPIFLMKCLEHVRHLEVQVLADSYGNAISLFGRDCSVQRRHQKILEEAPCVTAPAHVFEAMEEAAIRMAKLVGYTSAGTVEYLYDPHTEEFFFLELNPRLQVEHPCTEVVADVNLPACQLEIGMGLRLHQIKDIRHLYQIPETSTQDCFDLAHKNRRKTNCHVIAVRITSEDPNEGFRPHPGDVQEINFKSSRSVWGYFSVGSIGGIHEFADSQFGHCFSAADNRELARV